MKVHEGSLPRRRITLELPVVDTTQLLLGLPGGQRYLLDEHLELHLTLLHVGRTDEVFDAVKRVASKNPNLQVSEFLHDLRNWLELEVGRFPGPYQVRPLRWKSFANLRVLLVDGIGWSPADYHGALLEDLRAFIGRWSNLKEAAQILREPAFGFTGKSYQPHISINTLSPLNEDVLPDLGGHLTLGRATIRNIDSLSHL